MSLYNTSGVLHVGYKRTRKLQLRRLLSSAVQSSDKDQDQDLVPKTTEGRETFSTLKSTCGSAFSMLCKALLDMIIADDVSNEVNGDELQQNRLQNKSEMFLAVTQAIDILFNKINTAVKQQEISPESVSDFLSYSDEYSDPSIPNAISALSNLYFLIDDPELRKLSYSLVRTFLINSAHYTLDTQGRTALHYAVNISNQRDQGEFLSDIIQKIIDMCPQIVYRLDKLGNNVMHYVTSAPYMNTQIAQYFSENFPTVNTQKNIHGDLPLHVMASVNFVFFAKVFSFFSLARVGNIKKLKDCLTNMTLSNMRASVASFKKNEMQYYLSKVMIM